MTGYIFLKLRRVSRLIVKILTEHVSRNGSIFVNFLTEHRSIGSISREHIIIYQNKAKIACFSDFFIVIEYLY